MVTVFFVLPPEFEMAVSFPGMVGLIEVRDLGQEWSGVL